MIKQSSRCRMCTKQIAESSYISEYDGVFCCERCYLDYMIQKRSQHERDEMQMVMGEALVAALDARESETGMHSKRVACHTQVLAKHVSKDEEWLKQVYWGSLLHDIGKIAIPDTILLKKGALTEEEWSVMRSHPQRGYDIVAAVPFMSVASKIILRD